MMEEEQFKDIIVNKSLYIGHEQQPIYKIFNERTNSMPRERATKRRQKIY
jgi:hypothetical protein